MKRKLVSLSFLLLSLCATGQEEVRGVAERGNKCWDVDSVVNEMKVRGQEIPYLYDWLSKVDKDFKGDADSFLTDVKQYRGASYYTTFNIQYGGHYWPSDWFPMPMYVSWYSQRNFEYGIYTFGPSYRKNSVLWIVDGSFCMVSGCKARVRVDTQERFSSSGWPIFMEDIEKVEIEEGNENFRNLIPHLKSWRGKTPTIIYVTTKGSLCYPRSVW